MICFAGQAAAANAVSLNGVLFYGNMLDSIYPLDLW